MLLLAGTRAQLDEYDSLFCIYNSRDKPVVIIGGGRVGSACARALAADGVDYRVIDKVQPAAVDPERFVLGDAADRAGPAKGRLVGIAGRRRDDAR